MLNVFNLLYLSEQESAELLRVLDEKEVEYEVINEDQQDIGWICVEDEDEYNYARNIVDEFLERPTKKKSENYKKKKTRKGAIIFAVLGAIIFLSRYLKDIFTNFG